MTFSFYLWHWIFWSWQVTDGGFKWVMHCSCQEMMHGIIIIVIFHFPFITILSLPHTHHNPNPEGSPRCWSLFKQSYRQFLSEESTPTWQWFRAKKRGDDKRGRKRINRIKTLKSMNLEALRILDILTVLMWSVRVTTAPFSPFSLISY